MYFVGKWCRISKKLSIFARYLHWLNILKDEMMLYVEDEYRREEFILNIERQIEQMTLRQLEMLYYELSTKDYSSDIN